MKLKSIILLFAVLFSLSAFSEKQIYLTSSFSGMNMDSEISQYCWARSRQSENFIIFWEAGYGANPNTVSNSSYKVNVDNILSIAENAFVFYSDSLKFITRGSSKTDLYKMIIRLRYTTDWEASGSGQDDMIGLLTLTASSAQAAGVTMAHEVGHCFQYQVHCDNNNQNGWMYGFGANASGGNCWWEQCAQWQAFKIFPEQQFTDYRFDEYLKNCHKNILHESPRYANYFIQDFWCFKHGMDIIGRLWNLSVRPEDPVETYRRITAITHSQFCDQMYECAARFTTWDIPRIRARGESAIDLRQLVKMTAAGDGYWKIDSVNCPENYGYNSILLNTPPKAADIKVYFEGLVGAAGYRYVSAASGWRYGFVSLLNSGERVYGEMRAVKGNRGKDTLEYRCPDNVRKMWLVVAGAPINHSRHAWDDLASNDEQWAYQVKFENTSIYGNYEFDENSIPHNDTLIYNLSLAPFRGSESSTYPSLPVAVDMSRICQAFCLPLSEIQANFGSKILYNGVNANGSLNATSTANAPGHWFTNTGNTTSWGSSAYIFSELKTGSFTFNIGQYPNRCNLGNKFTVRQAFVYKKSGTETSRVLFVFNIVIAENSEIIYTGNNAAKTVGNKLVVNTQVFDILKLTNVFPQVTIRNLNSATVKQQTNTDEISMADLPAGIYLVTANGKTEKVIKY